MINANEQKFSRAPSENFIIGIKIFIILMKVQKMGFASLHLIRVFAHRVGFAKIFLPHRLHTSEIEQKISCKKI